MSHAHEFTGGITRYSENVSDRGSEHPFSRGMSKSQVRGTTLPCRVSQERAWTRRFAPCSLPITSETEVEINKL